MTTRINRRRFMATSAKAVASTTLVAGVWSELPARADSDASPSPNDRPGVAAVGMRYQGSVITNEARPFGDIVAIADVDRHVREQARASFGSTPRIHEDYRQLLDRSEVDIVLIATPDHWHAKMVVDACRAGKDVYIEKPLTLTIDEGKVVCRVVKETGRVVQVGSWQRSDRRFRLAAEMVRAGRVGTLQRVTCTTDKNPTGGPFESRPIPEHINWNLWQGQTASVPYIPQRCHYTFRWWYDYSGGKMTDWGAHHLDIAQWAIGEKPVGVHGRGRFPTIENGYDVASDFQADFDYPSGVRLLVRDEGRRGILFEGEKGRIFVNRAVLAGSPVDQLAEIPLPRDEYRLYGHDDLRLPERTGKIDAIKTHMANFFDCVRSRKTPISDIVSQHESVTTCHLANISMRLGRSLQWDPDAETFVGDDEANTWLKREQRKGFEVA
jgi:myo-inositol 2-dehydrogenase/D-chiro-inositol 1-dehydrogenase